MKINDTFRVGPARLRYLLGGALVIIFIAHLVLLAASPGIAVGNRVAVITSVASIVATVFSVMLARSVARYPGVEAGAYFLPSFFIGYGVLFTAFLLSRLAYSRALLVADLLLTLFWTVVVSAVSRRRALRIGVVPEGRYQGLLGVPSIRCHLLDANAPSQFAIDAVAADLHQDIGSHWDRFLADCALRGIPVYHTKHLMESLTGKVELEHLSENSFGMLTPVSAFMTIKHVVDWCMALLFSIVLLPAFAAVAIAIRLDSPGRAIFRQQRIGYRGRPFTVYKFRTMNVADARSVASREAAKTADADDRITRIGGFLRRTRIDELPQVINILRAEMSWIGPRPEAQILSEWYEAELPFYPYRHIVRPGITGWAQVSQGHVAEIAEVRAKLYYDFYYIKHYSLWIDLLIIARTIITVFTGTGAK